LVSIATCRRCSKEIDVGQVPFLDGTCWPCLDLEERQILKERLLHGYSIADKSFALFIEKYETEVEQSFQVLPNRDEIDFEVGYENRFIPKKKRKGRGGWMRK